jgi:hypothetical protein
MSVVRSPVRSAVNSVLRGALGPIELTDLQRVQALSPGVLYWRAQNAGTVGIDGTGGTATGTSPVGRIIDLSGNSNHASAPASGNRATLNTTGWVFDGTDDHYNLASAIALSTNMTIIRGFKRASAGIISLGLGTAASAKPYDMIWFNNNIQYSDIGPGGFIVSNAANTNTGSFVSTLQRDGSAASLRLNGAAVATTFTADTDGASLSTLGRRNTDYSSGELTFLAAFPSKLTGSNLTLVEQIAAASCGATLA